MASSANSDVGNDGTILPEGAVYATGRQLARRYQVSAKWVTARAAHLGATPISDAANSELRYHLPTADAYMESRRRAASTPRPRRSRPRQQRSTTRTGAPLLSFARPESGQSSDG